MRKLFSASLTSAAAPADTTPVATILPGTSSTAALRVEAASAAAAAGAPATLRMCRATAFSCPLPMLDLPAKTVIFIYYYSARRPAGARIFLQKSYDRSLGSTHPGGCVGCELHPSGHPSDSIGYPNAV